MRDTDTYAELAQLAIHMASKASTTPWLFTGEDALRVRLLNSLTGVRVVLEGRILTFDGVAHPFAQEFTPNTDRTETTHLARPGDGFLLNWSLRASAAAPRIGQCFATVEVVRGALGAVQVLGALGAGYVTNTQRLLWPGENAQRSIDGRGVIRSITGTDPGVGIETSETVPTNARWRLIAWRATLVTDATVVNRIPSIVVDDGAIGLYAVYTPSNHTASQTWIYNAAAVGQIGAINGGNVQLILPTDLILMGGFRLRTSTLNFVAGDNWGAPQLLVEEWIED